MNTKLIASLLLSIFFSLQIQANANSGKEEKTTTTKAVSLEKQIQKSIAYPNFAKNVMMAEDVFVKFIVTKDSLIQIQETFADNPHLEAFVKDQLNNIKVMVDGSFLNKSFAIKLVFK